MAQVRIPPQHKSALVRLQQLSGQVVDDLIGVLRRAPVKFYGRDLAAVIKDQVTSISSEDLIDIIDALVSMEYGRVSADRSIEMFMSDLVDAMRRDDISTENADGTSTTARIRQLLQVPSLGVPAKARTLLLEGKTLCRARVISDIRPVFDASEEPVTPEAALIVHNLRISYHEGSRAIQEFVVALDSNDLDQLIDMLTRAKAKQQALHGILDLANTPYLEIE